MLLHSQTYKINNIQSNIILKEFDSFSDAFRYAIDKEGLKPVDIYTLIGMDAGYFSNIYTGEIKNPQSSTRNKLLSVVDFDISIEKGKWVIEYPDHSQDSASSFEENLKNRSDKLSQKARSGKVQRPNENDLVRQLEAAESLIRLAIDNLKKK